jgi:hypothetical protein
MSAASLWGCCPTGRTVLRRIRGERLHPEVFDVVGIGANDDHTYDKEDEPVVAAFDKKAFMLLPICSISVSQACTA